MSIRLWNNPFSCRRRPGSHGITPTDSVPYCPMNIPRNLCKAHGAAINSIAASRVGIDTLRFGSVHRGELRLHFSAEIRLRI